MHTLAIAKLNQVIFQPLNGSLHEEQALISWTIKELRSSINDPQGCILIHKNGASNVGKLAKKKEKINTSLL